VLNIGSLEWHYNNTLNKLTKANKPNTTQYYVYDYQGKRVRTVTKSNHQVQSQRDYLPALDGVGFVCFGEFVKGIVVIPI
jgi:hypothetical protein